MADNLTDPNINRNEHDDTGGVLGKRIKSYVWNSTTLVWEKATQASGGGGGDGAILDGVNSAIKATVQDLGTQLTTNDLGLVTNTVIHGLSSGGGGGYVDVKVTPSGALTTADTIADGDDVATGATTDAANTSGTTGTISGKLRGIVQNQTNGTQQTKLTDGTNVANVVSGNTGNAVQTSHTTGTPTTFSITTVTQSSVVDVANYGAISVQITTQGTTSTVTPQWSNDNTNWYNGIFTSVGSTSTSSSTTSTGLFSAAKHGRYFRLNVTGITAGTTAGTMIPLTNSVVYGPATSITNTPVSIATTGSIIAATTSIVSGSLNGYSHALVTLKGTYTGISFGITVSDDAGTTYYNVPVWDIQNNKYIAPGTTISPSNNSTVSFLVPIGASTAIVKVLASAWASGTGSVRISATSTPPLIFSQNAQLYDSAGNGITSTSNALNTNISSGTVIVTQATAANLKVDLSGTSANSTAIKVDGSAVTQPVSGTVTSTVAAVGATGSAVPASGIYDGYRAATALPTAATAGNLIGAMSDKYGRLVTVNGTIRDLVGTQTTTIAASTAETTIVTAAASTFNDLTAITVANTSTTPVRVDFRSTTAGSVIFSLYVPGSDVRGITFQRPVPQAAVNTNWTAQSSASVTDLRVFAVYDKNA